MSRIRADQLLTQMGLAPTRTRARAYIMAGVVYAGDKRVDKAGTLLNSDTDLRIKGRDHPWVSRGGCKLDHAITAFSLPVRGKIGLDIGASTGGFTDVLCHYGAREVYAVDVGYNQIAWSLRQNPHVHVIEKCNARYLNKEIIPHAPDMVVCDASFIGLRTILPAALSLIAPGGWAVALIKPQFETPAHLVGRGGIIRDSKRHHEIIQEITTWWENLEGWHVLGVTPSPIHGAKGNKEFLIAACYHPLNES